MPIQFTTDDSPGHRRLALWQDIVCDVFVGLDCKSDLGSAFRGSVTPAPLGKAACSEVCSDRQHVFRTPSRIARSDQDFILIALGNRGAGGVVQDGRETVIHPGEFALYDTTRPYELKFDGHLHADHLQGAARDAAAPARRDRDPHRRSPSAPTRRCRGSPTISSTGSARARIRSSRTTPPLCRNRPSTVLAMALGERLGKTPLPSSTHRSALLYRLKAHIRAHLADPDLSLSETAAALGISSRYVNDLLADEDTSFQRYVLGERLAQCRRDLASPVLAHRHISEIAFAWGFNDLSHFGRVFREHFGMSPRDFRQSQLRH